MSSTRRPRRPPKPTEWSPLPCAAQSSTHPATYASKNATTRRSARSGGHVGYVGVAHGVQLPGEELFYAEVHLHGGPAPVRRFLPQLIQLIEDKAIDPGQVFDLTLPLDQAAEAYRAMDERRAIKALLRP